MMWTDYKNVTKTNFQSTQIKEKKMQTKLNQKTRSSISLNRACLLSQHAAPFNIEIYLHSKISDVSACLIVKPSD